jgi:hypothetical protein
MTQASYPYRGGVLIPRPYCQGWQVDLEIKGEVIGATYTNSEAASKEQAVQEATKVANLIISSRERSTTTESAPIAVTEAVICRQQQHQATAVEPNRTV